MVGYWVSAGRVFQYWYQVEAKQILSTVMHLQIDTVNKYQT